MTVQIDTIQTDRFRNGAHFEFHSSTIERAKANSTVSTRCAKVLTPYVQNFTGEDTALKISQKSFLSDEIAATDKWRDDLYKSLRKAIKAMVDFPVEDVAAAAKVLAQSLKDYNIDPSEQMDQETGLLQNLLTDLKGPLAEQAELLHLTPVVEQLEEANNQMRTLLEQRNDAYATRKIGAMQEARDKVDSSYRQFIQVVNALILLEEDENLIDFAQKQNAAIKRYKQQVLNQTSGNKKPDEEEEEEEPTPEPVKPEITEVYSKVEDVHDPTGITRGKETIMKWVGDFELINETGDGPGKIIVKDNFTGVEEVVPVEDILSRSNTGCEFIMIRDFAEGEYKIRIETYDGGSPLVLEYPEVIKLV